MDGTTYVRELEYNSYQCMASNTAFSSVNKHKQSNVYSFFFFPGRQTFLSWSQNPVHHQIQSCIINSVTSSVRKNMRPETVTALFFPPVSFCLSLHVTIFCMSFTISFCKEATPPPSRYEPLDLYL